MINEDQAEQWRFKVRTQRQKRLMQHTLPCLKWALLYLSIKYLKRNCITYSSPILTLNSKISQPKQKTNKLKV